MSAYNSRAPRNTEANDNHGFITFTLPNGEQLEGYVVLSPKNLARLGLREDQIDAAIGKSFTATATLRTKSDPKVVAPVELF